jgi:hypothetical protein
MSSLFSLGSPLFFVLQWPPVAVAHVMDSKRRYLVEGRL